MTHADAYNRLVLADEAAACEQAAWLREAFSRRGVTFGERILGEVVFTDLP